VAYGCLFERLTGQTVGPLSRPTEDELATSILNHLNKLLQTRQGTVLALPEYGLPDLNDASASFYDSISRIRRHVEKAIIRYEPRLSAVQVLHDPDPSSPLALRFRILGMMAKDDLNAPLELGLDLINGAELRLQRVV